jgi:hypothetical protein
MNDNFLLYCERAMLLTEWQGRIGQIKGVELAFVDSVSAPVSAGAWLGDLRGRPNLLALLIQPQTECIEHADRPCR